ncbi:MAG TPA: erythromycin esterase family protein [Thermoanaerobaculia bacterium]
MLILLLLATLARPVRAGWTDVPERWLPSHAIDASALVALASNANVVALGDATHGTHEFFAAKQQLVPLLANHGFRTIAFEAPYAEWERGQYSVADYYFWYSEETLALIEWAKSQNIRIAGLDSSHPMQSADLLIERVRATDPPLADTVAQRLSCLTDYRDNPLGYSARAPIDREVCRASVAAVRPLLHDDELAHNARVVEQGEESLWTQLENRDAVMAENIEWLAARDGRVIVLGHNEHFGKTPYTLFANHPLIESAGEIVSRHVPYFVVGSIALKGSYITYNLDGDLIAQPFPSPSSDDYALSFAAAGLSMMFVPLGGVLPSWLATPHHIRIAGSSGPMFNLIEDLAKKFDAVMYVETSTPAQLRR